MTIIPYSLLLWTNQIPFLYTCCHRIFIKIYLPSSENILLVLSSDIRVGSDQPLNISPIRFSTCSVQFQQTLDKTRNLSSDISSLKLDSLSEHIHEYWSSTTCSRPHLEMYQSSDCYERSRHPVHTTKTLIFIFHCFSQRRVRVNQSSLHFRITISYQTAATDEHNHSSLDRLFPLTERQR